MNKVEVLKNYLNYVVEHKDDHWWDCIYLCHCGLFLKSLNKPELIDSSVSVMVLAENYGHYIEPGYYKYVFEYYKDNYCHITTQPFTEVVNQLVSYGFTLDELANLEHLQDKRFLDIDINSNKIREVDTLITYLTNWIKYEEQLTKVSTKEVVTVSCSK